MTDKINEIMQGHFSLIFMNVNLDKNDKVMYLVSLEAQFYVAFAEINPTEKFLLHKIL